MLVHATLNRDCRMLLLPLPQRQPPSNASKPTLQPLQLQLPLQRVSLKIQKSALAQDHLEQQRLQSQKGDVSRFFFQHIVWSSVQQFCAGSDSKRSAAANVATNVTSTASSTPAKSEKPSKTDRSRPRDRPGKDGGDKPIRCAVAACANM